MKQDTVREITPLMAKVCLNNLQAIRELQGITMEVSMVSVDTPVARAMKAMGQTYSDAVKQKDHDLGPPHLHMWGAMMGAMAAEHGNEKIKELIARQEGYTQQQLGTIVKACRLQKAYDKQNIKIIWAAPDLESEMKGAIRASLVQSGAKHLVGSPARGGLENSLQKMLDKS